MIRKFAGHDTVTPPGSISPGKEPVKLTFEEWMRKVYPAPPTWAFARDLHLVHSAMKQAWLAGQANK